ncbi:MAG: hemerythrin [Herminiimonas sp.]|jgi:hemerythrin-like domain-containing protein|nr:hemerythrin [Herminiimonas sp.]
MAEETVADAESRVTRNAIDLLTADHRKAETLFNEYDGLKEGSPEEKYEVAKKVCGDLLIHMALEEAIFYPAVREKVSDEELVNEAEVEHNGAKDLIRQLGEIKPDDPMFDATMKVLSEQIDHHVQEEESSMFPKARLSGLDINALGAQLQEAKNEMRTRLGLEPE